MKFEIRKSQDPKQPFYWRIVTGTNNKILAHSETYVDHADCMNAIALIKEGAAEAKIEDHTV